MKPIRIFYPGVEISLKPIGSIKIQEVGILDSITISKEGIEAEYEAQAKYAFYEFSQGLKLKLTKDGIGLSWTYKSGTELTWTKVEVSLAEGGIKETISPKPVDLQLGPFTIGGERRGPFRIEGELGFEVTIKGTPAFYAALAATGVVVVVVTLPEDVIVAAFAGAAEIATVVAESAVEVATEIGSSFWSAMQALRAPWIGAAAGAM